ncbi:MAG: hypothetical protein ACREQI_09415, partial [Candidatus Binataceae bacterium]
MPIDDTQRAPGIDAEAASAIRPHLLAGETILWAGRPRYAAALGWRAGAIIAAGAAAIFLRAQPADPALAAVANGDSIFLLVLAIVLVAEAIVFHSHLSATVYGVTNRRAIVLSGLLDRREDSVALERLNSPKMNLRRIGRNLEICEAGPESFLDAAYLPFTNPSAPP